MYVRVYVCMSHHHGKKAITISPKFYLGPAMVNGYFFFFIFFFLSLDDMDFKRMLERRGLGMELGGEGRGTEGRVDEGRGWEGG